MVKVNQLPETVEYRLVPVRRLSWGAVFAGVVMALTMQLLLAMLGLGIGLSTIDPLQGETPTATELRSGAGIWWVVTGLIALLMGGWAAGRLANVPRRVDGMLHGVLTWGLATLLTFYLLTTAVGQLIGGALGVVGSTASAVMQAAGAAAPSASNIVPEQPGQQHLSWEVIRQEALSLLRQTGATAPQTTEEFRAALERLLRRGKGGTAEADRQSVVNALMAQTDMSREEATQTVRRWERMYQDQAIQTQGEQATAEGKQPAAQTAQSAAETMSTASFWTFVAMLLGAIAAAIGGAFGAPRERSLVAARID